MNTLRNELKRDYSQIPNELITDLNLCNGSLRVLLYLFTKPDDWNVYNKDICKRLNISEQTLTKYWKKLLNSGWLKREPSRDKSGKLTGGYTYLIGNFTVSIKSTDSVKSIDYSKNKPLKKKETNKSKYDLFLEELKSKVKLKSKVTSTNDGRELFKSINDKDKLINEYIKHQDEKGEFAKRITAFMLDYTETTEEVDWLEANGLKAN